GRAEQSVPVGLDAFAAHGLDVLTGLLGGLGPAPVDDVRRTLGTHDRDLGGGPGEVDIGPELLRAHHTVGPAVGLAGDECDQGDGGLTIGVDELGSTSDDAAVLLIGA